MSDRGLINHEAQLLLEQPFLKVPHEQLHMEFRNTRKILEREITGLQTQWKECQKKMEMAEGQEQKQQLQETFVKSYQQRIQGLKRKMTESSVEEMKILKRLRSRVNHLDKLFLIKNADSDEFNRWSKQRLDRLICDYLLRNGFYSTADALVEANNMQDWVDSDLFLQEKRIEQDLQRHSCTECLAWCHENKGNLRKNKSTLEFELRVQEFVEMVRKNTRLEAVHYARRYFPAWIDTHMKEIQHVMGLLAFQPDTKCLPYKKYFAVDRWNRIIKIFRRDHAQLHNLPRLPLLFYALQAGLTALKTPSCYHASTKNLQCPVCSDALGRLAEAVPFAHHVNSCLVCRVTGEVMDEDNPPLVLPNGHVYSQRGIQQLMKQAASTEKFIDPRSGEVYTFSQCRKAYLA